MLLDQTHMNRLANIAFLHDDADSAKKVLRLLLADDLKQEKKKMEDEAKLSPTEKFRKKNGEGCARCQRSRG